MVFDRNGSVKTITEIVQRLNEAKLDENTGIHSLLPVALLFPSWPSPVSSTPLARYPALASLTDH